MTTPANPQQSNQPTAGDRLRRPVRRVVLAVAAGGLLLGGTAYAGATATGPTTGVVATTPSTTAPAPPPVGAHRPAPRPHLDGIVSATSATTVTVTDHDGFTRTIRVTSATSYGSGLTAPLPVGTHIHAVGTVDADKTSLDATAITAPPATPGPPPMADPKKPHPEAHAPHRPGKGPAAAPKPPNPTPAPGTSSGPTSGQSTVKPDETGPAVSTAPPTSTSTGSK